MKKNKGGVYSSSCLQVVTYIHFCADIVYNVLYSFLEFNSLKTAMNSV
jgi:hypothetical protein